MLLPILPHSLVDLSVILYLPAIAMKKSLPKLPLIHVSAHPDLPANAISPIPLAVKLSLYTDFGYVILLIFNREDLLLTLINLVLPILNL